MKPAATSLTRVLWIAFGVELLVQLLVIDDYGWFRDEFYYLACAEHLDWGYVDQPPLSIAVLAFVTKVFGSSIGVVRMVPALAGAFTVMVCGRIAMVLGGGRVAVILATISAIVAPQYLALHHFYSMNAFEILLWAVAALLVAQRLRDDEPAPRQWLWIGVVLGLGLQNKISVLWLGAGLGVGLLLAGRQHLRGRGPWLAAAVAVVLFAPHVVWQVAHGWPTVEFIENASGSKMQSIAPLQFIGAQFDIMGFGTAPIWLAGLWWLLRPGSDPRFRPLGWAYLVVLTILIVNSTSRAGYLAPAYTWLFAAGGVAIEGWAKPRRYLGWAVGAVAIAFGVLMAPFAIPILPVDSYIAYSRALGQAPSTAERKQLAELPQWYADMHGWPAFVDTVARVYESLPPAEKDARIFTFNYGEAGALQHLGRDRGLPPVVSGHNNYWMWGPGPDTETVIVIGGSGDDHAQNALSVRAAATIDCGRCMPYENGQTVWVLRFPADHLRTRWDRLRHFD